MIVFRDSADVAKVVVLPSPAAQQHRAPSGAHCRLRSKTH